MNNKKLHPSMQESIWEEIFAMIVALLGLGWFMSGFGIAIVINAFAEPDSTVLQRVLACLFCGGGWAVQITLWINNRNKRNLN